MEDSESSIVAEIALILWQLSAMQSRTWDSQCKIALMQ